MLRRDDQLAAELHPSARVSLDRRAVCRKRVGGLRKRDPRVLMLKQYESTLRDSTNPSQSGVRRRTYRIRSRACSFTRIFSNRKPKKGTDKWYDQSADCLPIRKKMSCPKSDTRIKKALVLSQTSGSDTPVRFREKDDEWRRAIAPWTRHFSTRSRYRTLVQS